MEKNNYPKRVIKQIFKQVKFINDRNSLPPTIETIDVSANKTETVTKKHMLLLPCQGDKGIGLTKSLKGNSNLRRKLHLLVKNLETQFNVKDRTKFEHKNNVIYFGECSEKNCTNNYHGESAGRISDRIIDHGGRDQKSHLFRHAVVDENRNVSYDDFEIIEIGVRNNTCKKRVAEALLIKELRSTLNIQKKSIELKLFN